VSRSPAALVDVEQVRPRVDALLADYVAAERDVLVTLGPDSAVLSDAVEQMLTGGKRLRAAFCYWSFRAHGGEPGTAAADAVLRVGAALELFQAAALFHVAACPRPTGCSPGCTRAPAGRAAPTGSARPPPSSSGT
jgi:geranylgeranyl diphosphate synthase type I